LNAHQGGVKGKYIYMIMVYKAKGGSVDAGPHREL
jgi:hypothetical protein